MGSCSSFKCSWQNHLNTLPSALHYYLSFFGSQRFHRCKSFAHPVSLQDSEIPHFSVAVLTALFHAVSFHTHLPWVSFDAVSAYSPVPQFAITCRDCLCTSLGVVEGEGFEPPAHPRHFRGSPLNARAKHPLIPLPVCTIIPAFPSYFTCSCLILPSITIS